MGKKTGCNPTDRGKQGVKRSLLTEGHGVPIGLAIEGANRADMKLVEATLDSLVIQRPEPSAEHPHGLCLDAGYAYAVIEQLLTRLGFTAHIRPRGEEIQDLVQTGKRPRRWVVERTHSWMNRFRRILVRWEKKADNYLAFLHFACGLIACRAAGLFG